MSALLKEQQLRAAASAIAPAVAPADAPESAQASVLFSDPISEQVDAQDAAAGSAKYFEGASLSRKRLLGRASTLELQEMPRPEDAPVLTKSEDLASDLSLRTSLRLSTAHCSFRWLRRLPAALRCQVAARADADGGASVRDAVLEVCRECLPKLLEMPEKAARWMERIAASLVWYQHDGPVLPSNGYGALPTQEDRATLRQVEEWDEAYRSLEVLLRQGLVSTFVVASERFTVVVCGEGVGPWLSSRTGSPQQPTKSAPCAVLFPSLDYLRTMLQENHVPFEVALIQDQKTTQAAVPQAPAEAPPPGMEGAIVCADEAAILAAPVKGDVDEQMRGDLRDLRRDGERVIAPEDISGVAPMSSAIWLEGAWRVHALLDVLRQHFLDVPLPSAAVAPPRLPRLLAPSPFPRAAARSAEVVRTQTVQSQGAKAPRYEVELEGYFFPGQVRKFLENLRVILPSFSCGMTVDARRGGINAFTPLGMRHIESVECARTQGGVDSTSGWKWSYQLGLLGA